MMNKDKTIKSLIATILMRLFGLFPIRNSIVFSSFDGKSYSDNPKAIFEYFRDNYNGNKEIEYIWIMRDSSINIPGAKVVKAYSLRALYYQAVSKIWVFNSRQRRWMKKRKNQFYIQTWHAGLGLKKVEKEVEDKLPSFYIESAKNDSKMADLFISASRWNTEQYRNSFWYTGNVLESGNPKSTIYYEDSVIIKNKVFEKYGITSEKKLVLYAPTFRDDKNYDYFNIDFDVINKSLERKFGGQWVFMARLHPNIQSQMKEYKNVLNGSEYDDMNELIIASEVLITDYSSCMFDAMEQNKKVILYTPDIDAYLSERGTNFEIGNLPFIWANNMEEICEKIQEFTKEDYLMDLNKFKDEHKLFNSADSTKLVYEEILKHI